MQQEEFKNWLQKQLSIRNWRIVDAAREGDMHPGSFGHVVNGERRAGVTLCKGIAKAFNEPLENVYRMAGLLPGQPEKTTYRQRMYVLLAKLDDNNVLWPLLVDAMEAVINFASGHCDLKTPIGKLDL